MKDLFLKIAIFSILGIFALNTIPYLLIPFLKLSFGISLLGFLFLSIKK